MFDRRLLFAVGLLAASTAEAFQLRAIQFPPATVEGDGQVFVAAQLEREPGDTASCDLTGNMSVLDSSNPVTANATGGLDYQPQTFAFTLSLAAAAGITEQVFPVTVFDDAVLEPDEVFLAQIDNFVVLNCAPPINQAPPANVLIVNDDASAASLSLVPTVLGVDEGAGVALVTVDLVGEASVQAPFTIRVDFSTNEVTAIDGNDFTPTAGTLAFDPNLLSQTISVPILEDALVEGDEIFTIDLTNAGGDQPGGSPFAVAIADPTTTVTIGDNDVPAVLQFSAANFSADEGGGSLVLTMSRGGDTSAAVSVDFATTDGTANAGADYTATSGTVSWPADDALDKTISVALADDNLAEGDETFTVTLSNPAGSAVIGSQAVATATITDNDAPGAIGFSNVAVNVSEDAGVVTLSVSRGGSAGGVVTVDFASVDGTAVAGSDYTAAAGTLTWADGDATDKTATVAVLDDTDDEPDETFTVVLSNVTGPANLGGNGSATVTISASDAARDIAAIASLNSNQRSLASWFDDVCPRLGNLAAPTSEQQDLTDICGSLKAVQLSDSDVRTALDAINPEELMVASFNALRLTAVQHGNLSHRINALRSGASGIDLAGLELEID
ncbi:MAG: hypothetical protein OES38_11635, partial [Gammaproteobacteria bacterium]|nr:hypothetical protein [Gammaproteobacteria bacterium]